MDPLRQSGGRETGETPSGPVSEAAALAPNRVRLHVLAAVSVIAVLTGSPGWTQVVLVTTTLLVPVAVAVQEGRGGVRRLLLPTRSSERAGRIRYRPRTDPARLVTSSMMAASTMVLSPVRGGTAASPAPRRVPDRTPPSVDPRRDSR